MHWAAAVLLAAAGVTVQAQSPQLVTLVTDATDLPLSNFHRMPENSGAANRRGDYAFVASDQAAFLRRAADDSVTRVLQAGDTISDLPGHAVEVVNSLHLGLTGVLGMNVQLRSSAGELVQAVLRYDGASVTTVAISSQTAPGTGGASYGYLYTFGANRSGDVAFIAGLAPYQPGWPFPTDYTLYIAPGGGAPIRVAGPGDAAPDVAGATFSGSWPVSPVAFNDNGEVLFLASLSGTSATNGFFVATTSSVRKVVANGDPKPGGGTFHNLGAGRLNNLGQVAFVSSNTIWIATPGTGPTEAVGLGDSVPGLGGQFGSMTLDAFNDAGQVAFEANVWGTATTSSGLFRAAAGGPIDTVIYEGQSVPNGGGLTFTNFATQHMNAAGDVLFFDWAAGTFLQSGSGLPLQIAAPGAPIGLAGGGVYGGSSWQQLLDDGSVLVLSYVDSGADDWAVLRVTPTTASVLVKATDPLPSGGRPMLSTPGYFWEPGGSAAANLIAFQAQRPGGGTSVVVHDLATRSTHVIATEGQIVPGTGRRLAIHSSYLNVDSSGAVAFGGALSGGPLPTRALFIARPGAAVEVVAEAGQSDAEGHVLSLLYGNTVPPSTMDASGNVLFVAKTDPVGGTPPFDVHGLFLGASGSLPQRIVLDGDVTAGGQTITDVTTTSATRSRTTGLVVFEASTASGPGLFIGGVGLAPVELVQAGDPAPGGGTFATFGRASMKATGEVTFMATVNGGPGGIFMVWAGTAPVALARDGDAAPGGGTFSMSTVGPDVLISDASDVLFMADLAGGSHDSGYFVRRAPAGPIEVVALGGDAAPGTSGVFDTFEHGAAPGQYSQLGSSGDVAIYGQALDGGLRRPGQWRVQPNGTIEPIVVAGQSPPGAGSGTVALHSKSPTGLNGGRWSTFVRAIGATFTDAIMLWAPPLPASVPAGAGVVVTPLDSTTVARDIRLTGDVSVAGTATVTTSASGPALPSGYALGDPAVYYEIQSTATWSSPIEVCVIVTGISFPSGATISLLQHVGTGWLDVTTSGPGGGLMCGTVANLSTFVVAYLAPSPGPDMIANGDFSADLGSWLTYATPDASYLQARVQNGVLNFYRVAPPAGTTNQAVVLQQTGLALGAFDGARVQFELGNSSDVRKRITVLAHDGDFSDLSACSFWLAPHTPLRTYEMWTHTTEAWTNATVSFYAASVGSHGGAYLLDNVVLQQDPAASASATTCVDPTAPIANGAPNSTDLLSNGDFSAGLTDWIAYGQIVHQVTAGVVELYRPAGTPAGVLLQVTGETMAAGEQLTATLDLGNSSAVRKRITILVHDRDFSDLSVCTFYLDPFQPLTTYSMRAFTTKPWTSATLSIYPATVDNDLWYRLDNASLKRTPGLPVMGTECVEPGG